MLAVKQTLKNRPKHATNLTAGAKYIVNSKAIHAPVHAPCVQSSYPLGHEFLNHDEHNKFLCTCAMQYETL